MSAEVIRKTDRCGPSVPIRPNACQPLQSPLSDISDSVYNTFEALDLWADC